MEIIMTEISPTIIWVCLGIALIILEIFTTTFSLLFFGIAALIVSVIKICGLSNLPAELIIFAALGILGILIFRKKIIKSLATQPEMQIDKNKTVVLTEDIKSHETGTIIYRGAPWSAYNESDFELKKGESAIIKKVDSIKLILTNM